MDAVIDQEQKTLVAQLVQARARIEALAAELSVVDAELGSLDVERKQHRLLLNACGALDELQDSGAAELFWGDRAATDAGADRVRAARSKVEAFETRVGEIEARRNGLIERIKEQQYHADVLEDGVFESLEEEERRQQEWIVEREISKLPARRSMMPWLRDGEDDRRFRKSLSTVAVLCLLVALIFPYIPLPTIERDATVEIPDRVVRLLMEARKQPPPPPRSMEQKPQEQLAEEKPETKVVPQQPAQTEQPIEEAPKVADQGILAFREKFAALQDDQVVARLGARANISGSGDSAARPQRAMLTTNAPGSSGGINLASLSRGVGGGPGGANMAGVQVTRVSSGIGAIGKPGQDRPLSGDKVAMSRTDEEIQIVFDRYKSALYRLYNRELRKDPTLRGQLVLRLTIEADGSVSLCELQASDMNAPELSVQVVDRVRTINFGAKDGIPAITILYPIDFLPAA